MLSLIHGFWAHGYKVFKILRNAKDKLDSYWKVTGISELCVWCDFINVWYHQPQRKFYIHTFITNLFLMLYWSPVKPWSFMKTLLWYFKQWKASTAAQHMGNRIYAIHVDLVCHFKTSIHSLYKKSPLMPMDLCLFITWFQNFSLSESKSVIFLMNDN